MKITSPSQPYSNLYLDGGGRRTFKAGELIQAVATKQHSPRQLTLQIGTGRYTAYAKAPVPIGQPLLLRVAQAGRQPVLELVHDATLNARSPRASTALPDLLSNLIRLTQSGADGQIPVQAQAAAVRLLSQLAEPSKLANADELRRLLINSGSFLEAKLLQAIAGARHHLFGDDWKALLLHLRHVLRGLSPQANRPGRMGDRPAPLQQALESFADLDASPAKVLLQQAEDALIRIELNQLSSRGNDDSNKQVWIVELPVKTSRGEPELIRMRIERDAGDSKQREPGWSLVLQMEVAPLGHLMIKLSLRGGRVSVHILADKSETAELVRRNLERLEHGLKKRGLEVDAVTGNTAPLGTAVSNPSTSLSLLA